MQTTKERLDVMTASLRDYITKHCLRKGDFVLSSGKSSSYYVDLKSHLLYGELLNLVGQALTLQAVYRGLAFNAIGGPATGALPIVAAFQIENYDGDDRSNFGGFYVRSEVRSHGTKTQLVGVDLNRDHRCLLVDDVTTSGQSLANSIKLVCDTGAKVEAVVSIVDRRDGAQSLFQQMDVPFCPLLIVDEDQNSFDLIPCS